MMKKRIDIAIVVVMLLSVFGLTGCNNSHTHIERIEQTVGIKLPSDIKIEHSYMREGFTNDRAWQYTVLKFSSEPTEFLTSEFKVDDRRYSPEYSGTLSFVENGKSTSFESAFDERLDGLKKYNNKRELIPIIPKENYPNWEMSYLTEINNNIAEMLYFPETLILIVYIFGT